LREGYEERGGILEALPLGQFEAAECHWWVDHNTGVEEECPDETEVLFALQQQEILELTNHKSMQVPGSNRGA